jgi:CBS-domain-containing membrane protein
VQQRLAVASRLDAAIVREELGRLGASPLRVADVMSRAVITAAAGEPLGAAAARMVKAGLKRLPVVDAGGALVGMLSRLDVLRQVSPAPAGSLPEPAAAQAALTLGEVMTANVPAAGLQDDLNTLVEKFSASGSHRLVVVDAAGRAVGLISDSDVVARLQPEQQKPMLAALRRAGRPPEGGETAAQLMSPQPLTAPPDCPLAEGVRRMLADSRKWLVVVDAAGRPVGLVDRRILLAALAPPYAG